MANQIRRKGVRASVSGQLVAGNAKLVACVTATATNRLQLITS